MKRIPVFGLLVLAAAGGCPQSYRLVPQSAVTAQITASAVSGSAPLPVYVSAAASSSQNGEIVGYLWDFAGQAQADTVDAVHTFTQPGRYRIRLTVIDSTGQQASTSVDIRLQGGPATAVILSDVDSGSAPLVVQFDGTASGADDDEILDYFWDFGDGGTARSAAPLHTFRRAGTYTVQLRVVTYGGMEATTTATISVQGGGASLQFNGGQFVTLPVSVDAALSAFTFTARFKAEAAGGRIVGFGSPPVTLDILPATQTLRLSKGDQTIEAIAADLAGNWREVTVRYDGNGVTSLALDGTEIASGTLTGSIDVTELIAGSGFRGKLAGVSFAGTAATADDSGDDTAPDDGDDGQTDDGGDGDADDDASDPGDDDDSDASDDGAADDDVAGDAGTPMSQPLGNWPMNEGSGQTLSNTVSGGAPGMLGASTASEAADPAWSSDSP